MHAILLSLALLGCGSTAGPTDDFLPAADPGVLLAGEVDGGPVVLEGVCATPASPCWRLEADYLWWYLRKMRVPPMLTFGPEGGTGVIGDPGTEIARGGRLTSRHDRYVGIRLAGEWAVDPDAGRRWQVRAFFLERDSSYFTVKYDRVPTLAVPYIDALTGQQQALIVQGTTPDGEQRHGGSVVYSRVELFGQEANYLVLLSAAAGWRLDGFVGLRFLQMRERLDQTSSYRVLPADSTLVGIEDHLQTFDRFYGAQVGLSGDRRWGRWVLDGRGAVALGATDEHVVTKGYSIHHTPAARVTADHGLRVLPSNTGSYSRAVVDVVTDLEVGVGVDLTEQVRLRVGYSLLTWARPVRPGDQLGPINLTQVSPGGLHGPALPDLPWREDYFWAQGVNAGVVFSW